MSLSHTARCVALFGVVAVGSLSAQEVSGELEELSYKMGHDIGQRMLELGIGEYDAEAFRLGLDDAFAEIESRLTPEQVKAAEASILRLQQEQMARQREELANAATKNLELGQQYLEENRSRDGVTETETGLQYEVVKTADGARPEASDTVRVHYRGTLIDGTEFDSSYARGQPAVFPLNRVISGWTEGLQLMPVGSTFRFVIPSDLAYGGTNQGKIGPNSTLIFDVELLGIESQ